MIIRKFKDLNQDKDEIDVLISSLGNTIQLIVKISLLCLLTCYLAPGFHHSIDELDRGIRQWRTKP